MNVNTYIAVCPYGKGKSHAYMFVNNRFYDSVTLYRVQRSVEGCIIFDDPETLKPYMSKKTWEKEYMRLANSRATARNSDGAMEITAGGHLTWM